MVCFAVADGEYRIDGLSPAHCSFRKMFRRSMHAGCPCSTAWLHNMKHRPTRRPGYGEPSRRPRSDYRSIDYCNAIAGRDRRMTMPAPSRVLTGRNATMLKSYFLRIILDAFETLLVEFLFSQTYQLFLKSERFSNKFDSNTG